MHKINIYEYLQLYKAPESAVGMKLVNVRGTNGSGKSSIAYSFIHTDPNTFELTYTVNGKEKVIATVCPNHKWLFLGAYRTKCGGMDSYHTVEQTSDSLELLYSLPYNILMEGVIASTIFSTYAELFQRLNEQLFERDLVIFTLLPPVETCCERVAKRNGGKPIKQQLIQQKWRMVRNGANKFKDAGFNVMILDNSEVDFEDTRKWFLTTLGMKYEEEPVEAKTEAFTTHNGLFVPDRNTLTEYEWYPYYKEPNNQVEINWDNMATYWYWVSERMNIWYNRVVLKQPFPWSDDIVFQQNRFTNAIRDLDRGTIVVIKEILSKLDEDVDDIILRKKEVILNTMVYRVFIRYETWKLIGFINLKDWKTKWKKSKTAIRKRRDAGLPVFHGAYFVNGLKTANPDRQNNHDKVENALCMCDNFYDRIDEIYDFVTTHNMKDCLEYLQTLPAVGSFNAYEYACDFALASRYTSQSLVPWTDDAYVNVGPGNKRGIDYIFKESGNLSDVEKNIYLRATWEHYMKEYGYYDKFMNQMPECMGGKINLRVVEHDLCEFQKYMKVSQNTGRCKALYSHINPDLEGLVI